MLRTVLFVISLAALVIARAFDLIITFRFDPSLTREGNPAVMVFGGGAWTLIVTALVPSVLVAGGLLTFWLTPSLKLPTPRANSLRCYIRRWTRHVVLQRHRLREYLRPQSHLAEGLQAIRLFGVGLTWALVAGSVVAIYAWTVMSRQHTVFRFIYQHLSVGRFSLLPSLVAVFGFCFGAACFFYVEYTEATTLRPPGGHDLASSTTLD